MGFVRIIEDKLYAIDSLARDAVDFVDDDAAELFVGHLKRHTLAVLDLKIVGRIIQPERFVRCDLFCIVAAILQSHEHTAILSVVTVSTKASSTLRISKVVLGMRSLWLSSLTLMISTPPIGVL